jgi:maltose alpha-D-glucosyltransferase/alpha-amylase
LPVILVDMEKGKAIQQKSPAVPIATVMAAGKEQGMLVDAFWDDDFSKRLLEFILKRRKRRSKNGVLSSSSIRVMKPELLDEMRLPKLMQGEQSKTSIIYGNKFILKIFRRLEAEVNPDLEIGRFLTEKTSFENASAVLAGLEYSQSQQPPKTISILRQFVENQGNAWNYTLDYLDHYFERAVARAHELEESPASPQNILKEAETELPPLAGELFAIYLEQAALLGKRTAQLHLALASDSSAENFAPEPYTGFYQQALFQSMRSLLTEVFRDVRAQLPDIPEQYRANLEKILNMEQEIVKRFRRIREFSFSSIRIRIHGDYHLGHVLFTGKDFVIINFEGDTLKPLSERKSKMSVMRDVSGMIRSFHYASYAALFHQIAGPNPLKKEDMEPWRDYWYKWTSITFLQSYFATCGDAAFIPKAESELNVLWDALMLEKVIYELGYELNHRRDWLGIPVEGIFEIMGSEA